MPGGVDLTNEIFERPPGVVNRKRPDPPVPSVIAEPRFEAQVLCRRPARRGHDSSTPRWESNGGG